MSDTDAGVLTNSGDNGTAGTPRTYGVAVGFDF